MTDIQLPKPRRSGGKPVIDVLATRETVREIKPDKLPLQVLSEVIWAAFGISRPQLSKRTAPSAKNCQEIDVYVSLEDGLYLYRPDSHTLEGVREADLRAASGNQEWVADVPVNLVYVADTNRMGELDRDEWEYLSAADTGFIAQNVYLYCTSEGLATVVRGNLDKPALAQKMGLADNQRIVLAQSVGYPS